MYFALSCTVMELSQLISRQLYPGRYSQKNLVGVCGYSFPKPSPYLRPKSAIFPILFMTWPKTRYPVYDRCGWHSCPKHDFGRAFVDGLIVASSKKHTEFKTGVQSPYPIYEPKWPKSIPYLWPKRLKNHTLWGRTYLQWNPVNTTTFGPWKRCGRIRGIL